MATTFSELMDKLKQVNEVDLLELLDISSEDVVLAFQDKIEERYEILIQEFGDEEASGESEGNQT